MLIWLERRTYWYASIQTVRNVEHSVGVRSVHSAHYVCMYDKQLWSWSSCCDVFQKQSHLLQKFLSLERGRFAMFPAQKVACESIVKVGRGGFAAVKDTVMHNYWCVQYYITIYSYTIEGAKCPWKENIYKKLPLKICLYCSWIMRTFELMSLSSFSVVGKPSDQICSKILATSTYTRIHRSR